MQAAMYLALGLVSALVAAPAAAADAIDVPALLMSNNCTVCHAADRRVIGPSYQEVAARYKGDVAAIATLATTIRTGGVGRWGQVPMPPMARLDDAQAKALAVYVLKQ